MGMRDVVVEVATSMKLLGGDGELVPLDSLAVVDLVVVLEKKLDVAIPTDAMSLESFISIESITAMVESLRSE